MEFTASCAEDAGRSILDIYNDARKQLKFKTSQMDMTTSADTAAEHLIVSRISEAFPNDSILAEEGTFKEGSSERQWIIDPLDGTANFVHGWNASAVSIGLKVKGQYVIGVIYDFFARELYVAATGMGAFKNHSSIPVRREEVQFENSFIGITGRYDRHHRKLRSEISKNLIMQAGDVRSPGSAALSFCYVADGRLDGSFGNGYDEWDMAAGIVIARESGCIVTGNEADEQPNEQVVLIAVPSLAARLRCLVQESGRQVKRIHE
jgi:myo-inositol-1(or 4)-monophosphatase